MTAPNIVNIVQVPSRSIVIDLDASEPAHVQVAKQLEESGICVYTQRTQRLGESVHNGSSLKSPLGFEDVVEQVRLRLGEYGITENQLQEMVDEFGDEGFVEQARIIIQNEDMARLLVDNQPRVAKSELSNLFDVCRFVGIDITDNSPGDKLFKFVVDLVKSHKELGGDVDEVLAKVI